MPNLLVDCSVLGEGYIAGHLRRAGIYRVVCELVSRLLQRADVPLRFTSSQADLAELLYCLAEGHPALYASFQPNSLRWRMLARTVPFQAWLHRQIRAATGPANGPSPSRPRLLRRKGLAAVRRALLALGSQRHPLRGAGLEDASAYLALHLGIPDEVRQHRQVRCGMILYDLIPVRCPQFCEAPFVRTFCGEVLGSIRNEDLVFCISEFTRSEWLAYRPDFPPDNAVTTPLAAAAAFRPCSAPERRREVRTKYGIPADAPYILSLCTLEPRKNLDGLIRAFDQLVSTDPRRAALRLVLAGGRGWMDERIGAALAATGPVRDRIVLTGHVQDDDLSPLYSGARCFAYLSHYEGFGLPPLEAMQCACPVLCSSRAALPEVVGDAGLLVDPDDREATVRALGRLLDDESLRGDLSARGPVRASRFSWERAANTILQHLCP